MAKFLSMPGDVKQYEKGDLSFNERQRFISSLIASSPDEIASNAARIVVKLSGYFAVSAPLHTEREVLLDIEKSLYHGLEDEALPEYRGKMLGMLYRITAQVRGIEAKVPEIGGYKKRPEIPLSEPKLAHIYPDQPSVQELFYQPHDQYDFAMYGNQLLFVERDDRSSDEAFWMPVEYDVATVEIQHTLGIVARLVFEEMDNPAPLIALAKVIEHEKEKEISCLKGESPIEEHWFNHFQEGDLAMVENGHLGPSFVSTGLKKVVGIADEDTYIVKKHPDDGDTYEVLKKQLQPIQMPSGYFLGRNSKGEVTFIERDPIDQQKPYTRGDHTYFSFQEIPTPLQIEQADLAFQLYQHVVNNGYTLQQAPEAELYFSGVCNLLDDMFIDRSPPDPEALKSLCEEFGFEYSLPSEQERTVQTNLANDLEM